MLSRDQIIENLQTILTQTDSSWKLTEVERGKLSMLKNSLIPYGHKNREVITGTERYRIHLSLLQIFGDQLNHPALKILFDNSLKRFKKLQRCLLPIYLVNQLDFSVFKNCQHLDPDLLLPIINKLSDAAILEKELLAIILNPQLFFMTENVLDNLHISEALAEAFIHLNQSGCMSENNIMLLIEHPTLAWDIIYLITELTNRGLLTDEIKRSILQDLNLIEMILELTDMLKELQGQRLNGLYSSPCILAACQYAKHKNSIIESINKLAMLSLLRPNNFINICRFADITDGYISAFISTLCNIEPETNLLTQDNIDKLPLLFEHQTATLAALRALKTKGKLTQTLLDEIFAKPASALLIAKANGGGTTFANKRVIKDYNEIQRTEMLLSQAVRTQTSFFSNMPMEILFKITKDVGMQHTLKQHQMDEESVETLISSTFKNHIQKQHQMDEESAGTLITGSSKNHIQKRT